MLLKQSHLKKSLLKWSNYYTWNLNDIFSNNKKNEKKQKSWLILKRKENSTRKEKSFSIIKKNNHDRERERDVI